MDNANGQLQIKYQKIATEYSKIRAQANVLKKAVIDEQTRNGEIRDQLKEKEVELRRADQELDSLTFRNQQLTKRITVLQEELDRVQNKTKKGRSKSSENKVQPLVPQTNHILDEEFQKKIVENAQLLSQISDKDTEIEDLLDRVQHLEYKLDMSEKTRLESDTKYRETIEKLEKEKHDAQRKLNEKLKQEETVSWSSGEGKREGYEFDLKSGFANHRQLDHSPFSSPSASRRSSKSTVEMGASRKHWSTTQDENSEEFDFIKQGELEKELNQWKAQYNLLKIKYDEINEKKSNSTMSQMDGNEFVEVNNMIGRLRAPFALPEEIEARETKIREYFLREIDKLVTEKHMYLAKNLAIITNSEVMNVHLALSEEKREKCEAAMLEAVSKCTNLTEDKEVQEGNYKSQLSTMSEHLANMNEKLIRQTEEIQHLKFELSKKNGRRGN